MSVKKANLFAERIACKALGKATCEDVDAVDKSEIIDKLEKMTTNAVKLAIPKGLVARLWVRGIARMST